LYTSRSQTSPASHTRAFGYALELFSRFFLLLSAKLKQSFTTLLQLFRCVFFCASILCHTLARLSTFFQAISRAKTQNLKKFTFPKRRKRKVCTK